MSDGQPDLLQAILETFPTLEHWAQLTGSGLRPVPGSELALDDDVWPYAPPSTFVSTGLSVAREHLHAVRLLIEARELFPSAASTLCRPALIGGATAVWILLPDDANERRLRALSLAKEDYTQHIKFARQVMETFDARDVRPSADEQLSRLELRRAQVEDVLAELGGPLPINMNDDIVPMAVEAVWTNQRTRPQVVSRWRSMSGAAHALIWHYFGNSGTTATDLDELDVGEISVGGDIDRLVMDYFSGFHITQLGWRLLAVRADRPELAPN